MPYTFIEALADMQRIMEEHPWWKRRVDGTPLANDLPVRAATLMMTKLVAANAAADAEMERVKACEHIACGDEGWEVLRNVCPSTAAVAGLRDAFEARHLALCDDCPPLGYSTDKTRCTECPRRADNPCLTSLASNEPCKPDAENLRRCTLCGFVVDLGYAAEKPR